MSEVGPYTSQLRFCENWGAVLSEFIKEHRVSIRCEKGWQQSSLACLPWAQPASRITMPAPGTLCTLVLKFLKRFSLGINTYLLGNGFPLPVSRGAPWRREEDNVSTLKWDWHCSVQNSFQNHSSKIAVYSTRKGIKGIWHIIQSENQNLDGGRACVWKSCHRNECQIKRGLSQILR